MADCASSGCCIFRVVSSSHRCAFNSGGSSCCTLSSVFPRGTLGAIGLSPVGLAKEIRRTKALLNPHATFGVDLLLPAVGGSARKTNKDYTGGALEQLVQVMVDERVPLFVCAVGLPPRWVVDKLHSAGTIIMNMVGAPKHASRALAAGVDIICAQGTEAGAHTGDISTLVLLPQVVDICKGTAVLVVGAGGICDGRGIAACLASENAHTPHPNGRAYSGRVRWGVRG